MIYVSGKIVNLETFFCRLFPYKTLFCCWWCILYCNLLLCQHYK